MKNSQKRKLKKSRAPNLYVSPQGAELLFELVRNFKTNATVILNLQHELEGQLIPLLPKDRTISTVPPPQQSGVKKP